MSARRLPKRLHVRFSKSRTRNTYTRMVWTTHGYHRGDRRKNGDWLMMILRRRNLRLQPRKVAFGQVCVLLAFPCCSCTERAETCTVSRASMHSHGCPAYRDGKFLAACMEIPPTQYPAFLCLLEVCNLFFQPWKACRSTVGIPAPSPLLVERSNLD